MKHLLDIRKEVPVPGKHTGVHENDRLTEPRNGIANLPEVNASLAARTSYAGPSQAQLTCCQVPNARSRWSLKFFALTF